MQQKIHLNGLIALFLFQHLLLQELIEVNQKLFLNFPFITLTTKVIRTFLKN